MNEPAKVRGRVIRDGDHGRINDIVEVDAADVAELARDVDFHPDSVKYAEQLATEKIAALKQAEEAEWL